MLFIVCITKLPPDLKFASPGLPGIDSLHNTDTKYSHSIQNKIGATFSWTGSHRGRASRSDLLFGRRLETRSLTTKRRAYRYRKINNWIRNEKEHANIREFKTNTVTNMLQMIMGNDSNYILIVPNNASMSHTLNYFRPVESYKHHTKVGDINPSVQFNR